jgi:hypothetical protein
MKYSQRHSLTLVPNGNSFLAKWCMNSLVKVPPYSKLNFQGKHFFTQNWCNITLKIIWNFKCNTDKNDFMFKLYVPDVELVYRICKQREVECTLYIVVLSLSFLYQQITGIHWFNLTYHVCLFIVLVIVVETD